MGLIEVKTYTSAAEMHADAIARRARLWGKPAKDTEEQAIEADPGEVWKPAVVVRSWNAQHDAHVYSWKVADYERKIKSLQMTVENKERAISRMIGDQDVPNLPRVTASDVCKAVLARCAADGFGNYTMSEIFGPRRDRRLIEVRHRCVAAVVRKCPHLSYVQIGRFFNRDHSTVISAARKMGVAR
jgi:hypothetical protein